MCLLLTKIKDILIIIHLNHEAFDSGKVFDFRVIIIAVSFVNWDNFLNILTIDFDYIIILDVTQTAIWMRPRIKRCAGSSVKHGSDPG